MAMATMVEGHGEDVEEDTHFGKEEGVEGITVFDNYFGFCNFCSYLIFLLFALNARIIVLQIAVSLRVLSVL
jgi:hypothetical protein